MIVKKGEYIMRKRGKKLVAMTLATSMALGTVGMQAFANEPTIATSSNAIVNDNGTTTEQAITTTTTTDPETGKVTVNVVIENTLKDTNAEDGVVISGSSESEKTTVTDKNGEKVEESWEENGTEKTEWTEEDSGDGEQEDVTVPLVPGQPPTKATDEDIETTGDINSPEGQTTTTTTDRTVTANTSDINVEVNSSSATLTPVGSEDNADGSKKEDQYYDKTHYHYDKELAGAINVDWENMPKDADYAYVGFAEYSHKYATVLCIYYEKDENGNIKYDENGKPIVEKVTRAWNDKPVVDADGNYITDLDTKFTTGSRPTMFWLKDEDGNYVTAYCTDAVTGTNEGYWYSVSNLEDSDYYEEGAASQIRSIVTNGYWGTNEGTGSLNSIVNNLKAAIQNGEIDNVVVSTETDEEGHEVNIYLSDIIGDMTEGEAMDAMQGAIWSLANQEFGDETRFFGAVEGGKFPTEESALRRMVYYEWLMSLKPTVAETTIINEKNSVKDMSLTIGDKVADAEANKDNDKDNDVYHSELNFSLAFVPGENDDLIVQVEYVDFEGQTQLVTRRLAGPNTEGRTFDSVEKNADGSYVIRGLKLSENEEFTFDLRLEGVQYLEQGVYFYAPVGGRDMTQSMVGIAEGTKEVDVSASVTVSFDVDENNHVVAERTWHDEYEYTKPNDPEPNDPPTNPDGDGGDGGDGGSTPGDPNPVTPLVAFEDSEVPLSDSVGVLGAFEIDDDMIPLGVLPATGDNSLWFMIVSLFSGLSLAGASFVDKMKKRRR